MAGENTIDIRLVDTTAIPGMAPGTSPAGQPTNLPALGQPVGTAVGTPTGGTSASTISGQAIGSANRGLFAFAEQLGKTQTVLDDWMKANANIVKGISLVGAALALGSQLISDTLNLIAKRTEKTTEASVARIRNDENAARRAEIERRFQTRADAARIGGTVAGAAAGAPAGLPGIIIGGVIGRIAGGYVANAIEAQMRRRLANFDELVKNMQALRDRGRELSRYDMRLATAFAQGDVNKIKRDIGEASIIGGQFAEVEMKQQQLDKINQQIGIIEKMKTATEQMVRLNEEMNERMADLDEKLKDLPEEMAKKIRQLGDGVKDPFQLLEDRGGFAGDAAEMVRGQREVLDQAQRARLNIPIFFNVQ